MTVKSTHGASYHDLVTGQIATRTSHRGACKLTDPRHRWAVIRDVLHQTESPDAMTSDECQRLCHNFADLFVNRIRIIKTVIRLKLTNYCGATDPLMSDVCHTGQLLSDLQPPTVDEVCKLINAMPAKSSVVDSIPTSVIIIC